jgi:threonine synthase
MRESGGWGAAVSDAEVAQGIALLARHEGIFAETAGGVTVAAARRLATQGRLGTKGPTVLCITGNGLKTPEAALEELDLGSLIEPRLSAVAELTRLEMATCP